MYNPQLDTFLCVVECGSFNKAAEKLYITPPAVIKQIICRMKIWICSFSSGDTSGADSDGSREIPVSGCEIYHSVYCRDSIIRARNAMQEKYQCYPYRHFTYDACSDSCKTVAGGPEILPGD